MYLLDSEAKDRVGEPKKGISRNSSKATSRDTSRPPSAIENHIDYFREPVVKSPPEPTRVKSPEQLLMRSPDPINWTVPLDTGKTFQVTQSVRDSGKKIHWKTNIKKRRFWSKAVRALPLCNMGETSGVANE